MTNPAKHRRQKRQYGIAAVELALVLPVLVLLMTGVLLGGRLFWHYTVAQKAAHDAARYMATVPINDIRSPTRAQYAADIAHEIAVQETSDLQLHNQPVTLVQCGDYECKGGALLPNTVRVRVEMHVHDDIFNIQPRKGTDGWFIWAEITMPYVGD